MIVTFLFNREDKTYILKVTCSVSQICLRQSVIAIIQVATENLEKIPDRVLVGEDVVLKVQTGGKNLGNLNAFGMGI